MNNYVLASEKSWHDPLFEKLKLREGEDWIRFSKKSEFTLSKLIEYNIKKVFIPHWSYIIPKEIWGSYECIVFHMTDLPYGRGGTPLQNLIARGHNETKISALKVNEGIDSGDIYLKHSLDLSGSAQEIFERTVPIIQSMIEDIIDNDINPRSQLGSPVTFKRRKPEDGNLIGLESIDQVYDHIRMLDAEGYPPAFLESKNFYFQFRKANRINDKEIIANVRIVRK